MESRDDPNRFAILDLRDSSESVRRILTRRPRYLQVVLVDGDSKTPLFCVLSYREFLSLYPDGLANLGPGPAFSRMSARALRNALTLPWSPLQWKGVVRDDRGHRITFDRGTIVDLRPESIESATRSASFSRLEPAFTASGNAPEISAEAPEPLQTDDEGASPKRYPAMRLDAPLVPASRCRFEIDLLLDKSRATESPLELGPLDQSWTELKLDVTVQCAWIEFDAEPVTVTVRRNAPSVRGGISGLASASLPMNEAIEVVAQFWSGARFCGSAIFKFISNKVASSESSGMVAPSPAAREPDLTVYIARETDTRLRWQMAAGKIPRLPSRLNGRVTLDPQFRQDISKRIRGFADLEPGKHLASMQAFGDRLWEVAPQEFREVFWAVADHHQRKLAIQFITEDPEVPWEIMRPSREGEIQDLISTEHATARWLADYEGILTNKLPGGELLVLAPRYRSASAERNATQFAVDKLLERAGARRVEGTRDALIKELEQPSAAPVRLLYFAGHGSFSPEDSVALIKLENGEQLTSAEVDRREVRLGHTHRPLVFLSACEVGNTTRSFGQPNGWAKSFLAQQFSAFLAPLWAVEENDAQDVTRLFFNLTLDEGKSLGEALRLIKVEGTQKSSTYCAYLLYGDVTAVF